MFRIDDRSHCSCHSLLLFFFGVFFSLPARTEIIRIEIITRQQAFGGRPFGEVGTYEKLVGKAYGEVDPKLPQNAIITDLQFAPVNDRGMVEYSMDIYLLKPVDLARGNHKLFAEIPNRGSKLFGGFNNSNGGNEPEIRDSETEGFLMNKGYTIVWCGWDISAGRTNNNLTITVPVARKKDGTSIRGISYEYISFDNDKTNIYALAYPAAVPDKDSAILTRRPLLNDPPQIVPASSWEFRNDRSISLLPRGTSFQQSAIYEFVYMAKDPLVAGLGFAAIRDFISFLRYQARDSGGNANPLAGDVKHSFSFAISQPARYMNDFQTLGFNVDEHKRLVFDGIENWLGGGSGIGLNYRFAQPGRTERNRQNHLFPEGVFPFAYPILKDAFSGKTAGRMSGYHDAGAKPKVLEINSSNEYWVKAASLLHSDLHGNDLPDPENVRFYLISGMQHGSGNGAGICQQLQNPTRAEPVLRALFIALDEWVTNGTPPPASNVPRRKDNTAALAHHAFGQLTGTVKKEELGWPDIPGVKYTGLITVRHYFNYGSSIKNGVISRYPVKNAGVQAYPNFVSKVDKDGNEVAGIRLPPVAVPVATLTGWALRKEGYGLDDGCESAGQEVPFKATRADRFQARDPRLSLEERYGTHEKYVEMVRLAAEKLRKQRLLLDADVEAYVLEAERSGVLR